MRNFLVVHFFKAVLMLNVLLFCFTSCSKSVDVKILANVDIDAGINSIVSIPDRIIFAGKRDDGGSIICERTNADGKLITIASFENSDITALKRIDEKSVCFSVDSIDSNNNVCSSALYFYNANDKVPSEIFKTERRIISVLYDNLTSVFKVLSIEGNNGNNIDVVHLALNGQVTNEHKIIIPSEYHYPNNQSFGIGKDGNLWILLKKLPQLTSYIKLGRGNEQLLKGVNSEVIIVNPDKSYLISNQSNSKYSLMRIDWNLDVKTISVIPTTQKELFLKEVYCNDKVIVVSFLNKPDNLLGSKTYLYYSANNGNDWKHLNFPGNGVNDIDLSYDEKSMLILSKTNEIYALEL